jgi:hypothetical protein
MGRVIRQQTRRNMVSVKLYNNTIAILSGHLEEKATLKATCGAVLRHQHFARRTLLGFFDKHRQNIGVACNNFRAVRTMNGQFVTVDNFVAKN